jgi:hypothetical protein
MAGYIAVSNNVGAMFNKAFTHAQNLGVKTAIGTELTLGQEYDHGDTWVRTMPTELQTRLTGIIFAPDHGQSPPSALARNCSISALTSEGRSARVSNMHKSIPVTFSAGLILRVTNIIVCNSVPNFVFTADL